MKNSKKKSTMYRYNYKKSACKNCKYWVGTWCTILKSCGCVAERVTEEESTCSSCGYVDYEKYFAQKDACPRCNSHDYTTDFYFTSYNLEKAYDRRKKNDDDDHYIILKWIG